MNRNPEEEHSTCMFITGPSHRTIALSIHASRAAARIDSGEMHAVGKCIHHTGRNAALRAIKFWTENGRVTSGSACMQAQCKGRPSHIRVTDQAVRGTSCAVIMGCSHNGSVVESHLHACNIHTGHSLQTARRRKVYWPAVHVV